MMLFVSMGRMLLQTGKKSLVDAKGVLRELTNSTMTCWSIEERTCAYWKIL